MEELVVEIPYKGFSHLIDEHIITFKCADDFERETHCKITCEDMKEWFVTTGTKPPTLINKQRLPEPEGVQLYYIEYVLRFHFSDHRDAIAFKLAWA